MFRYGSIKGAIRTIMAQRRITAGKGNTKRGIAPVAIALAASALALPGAVLAVGGVQDGASLIADEFTPFTPASVDPQLARRVAADIGNSNMRFTPAGGPAGSDRTITVAVRVDDATARAISVRGALDRARSAPGTGAIDAEAGRFNLGISRGYRNFAGIRETAAKVAPGTATRLPAGVRKMDMPDLAEFKPAEGAKDDRPSRFQPRIALETEQGRVGRTPRTLDALGEQSVDVGGAYRVSRNLDVTAGVRLSQERDRLAPLTDEVQDSQAVYVGTQIRF